MADMRQRRRRLAHMLAVQILIRRWLEGPGFLEAMRRDISNHLGIPLDDSKETSHG